MAPPRSSISALFFWLACWALTFAATHTPLPPERLPSTEGLDKVVHFGMYAVLTLLGGRFMQFTASGLSAATIGSWALIYALYGVFDEWSQAWVGRETSFADYVANILGILFASFVLMHSQKRDRHRGPE